MNHQRQRKKMVKRYESKKLRKKLKKKQNRGSETHSEARYQSVTAFWVLVHHNIEIVPKRGVPLGEKLLGVV